MVRNTWPRNGSALAHPFALKALRRLQLHARIVWSFLALVAFISLSLCVDLAPACAGNVSYVYDALGRLIAVYDPSGNAAVYSYDAVGNLLSITNYSSTQFSGIDLSSSSGQAGATITIYGTGFCASPTVTFNGVEATVTSSTETQIVVTVPNGATSGSVVVTCNSNSITVSTFDVVASLGAPSISGFTPTMGTAGTAVTISGSNFETISTNNQVRVGGNLASVSSSSTSALDVNVTSGSTTGHISVTTSVGTVSSSGYFFVPPAGLTLPQIGFTGSTSNGTPIIATVSTAGTSALVAFDESQGQPISVSLTNSTFGACYGPAPVNATLYSPTGFQMATVGVCGNAIFADLTATTTGTYTVLITPAGSVTGSLTVEPFVTSDLTATMTIGGPPVTIGPNVPGQDMKLTFAGTAGQVISLSATNSTFGCWGITPTILNPDGSTLSSLSVCNGNPGGEVIPDTTLPQTGTYTISIDPGGNSTGSVTLQLYNAAESIGTISIDGPSVTVSNVPGQDMGLTFSGTTGQVISLLTSNSTYGCWGASATILNPDGTTLTSLSICDGNPGGTVIPATTLQQTGTYTIFIDPAGGTAGSVTLQLYNAAEVTGTISLNGPPVTVSNVPGQYMALTFSGTADKTITLLTSNSTYGCWGATATILNPDATTLTSLSICDGNPGGTNIYAVKLPQTGTYTISIVSSGGTAGSVTLQLLDLTDMSSTVNVSDTYAQTILGDSPGLYWRLDESGSLTAIDAVPIIKYGIPGPASPDTAIGLDGSSGYVSTSTQISNPSVYSEEVWFKTATSSGGKLIGFGTSQTGASGSYDRHIYMTNSGQLIFGQYPGSVVTVTSPGSYNDGFWHQAVGTYDGSTMTLFVDGSPVGSISSGPPQNYNGYWRLGYDNLGSWPSAPSSYVFHGSIGEASVYSTALTATQVSNHYIAASAGNYDSVVLADSPTSYWKLNESSGPVFADATGSGNSGIAVGNSNNNGMYQGGVTYGQPGAISTDNAVSFDGSSGDVQSVLGPPFGNANASLEAWVYIPSTWTPASGSYSAVIQAGTNNGIGFGIGNDYQGKTGLHLFGLYEYVRWVPLSNDPALSANTWYHIVMTVDGSGVPTFYINNTSYSQASGGGAPGGPTGSLFVGNDPAAGNRFFGGTIDEVAAYNYALSAAQVANHYHASGR